MDKLKFNDGTKPMECRILLKAESCLIVVSKGLFYVVNRSKVDESKEPEFQEDEAPIEESTESI